MNNRALTSEKPCINKAIHTLLMQGYATFNMIVPGPQICLTAEHHTWMLGLQSAGNTFCFLMSVNAFNSGLVCFTLISSLLLSLTQHQNKILPCFSFSLQYTIEHYLTRFLYEVLWRVLSPIIDSKVL